MSKPEREIIDFLAREYGISKTWVEQQGNKHFRICFAYDGKNRHVTMGHGPTIDWRSLINRKADIRRELGPPPEPARKEPRTLEEMMDELRKNAPVTAPPLSEEKVPKPASETWELRIGAYVSKNGVTLLFSFPRSIMRKFPAGIKIEKLDEENWKFSSGKGSKFVPYYGDRVKISHTDPKCPIFGSSPGEAVESDGDVLVYCPISTRAVKPIPWVKTVPAPLPETPKPLPTAIREPPEKVTPVPQEPSVSEPPPPPAKRPEPPYMPFGMLLAPSAEHRMRNVLHEVRDIEANSLYRLTRLASGRIVWRAPEIE